MSRGPLATDPTLTLAWLHRLSDNADWRSAQLLFKRALDRGVASGWIRERGTMRGHPQASSGPDQIR